MSKLQVWPVVNRLELKNRFISGLVGQELIIVTAITCLGAGLRLFNIGKQSLWFDELLSVAISRLPWMQVIASPASIDPPLYYMALHAWMKLSTDDAFIRTLSALASIAAIPALYLLGRQLLGVRVAFMAALIMAVAPLQLYYAQEARMYAWVVLFAILSVWAYQRAWVSHRGRYWAIWVIVAALMIYSHTAAGLLILALDADALIRARGRALTLGALGLSNAALAILLLPEFVVTLGKLTWLSPALWLQPPTILHPLLTLYSFVFGYTLPFPATAIAFFVLLVALVFIVLSSWKLRRSPQGEALRLLWLALVVPIGVLLLISQWRSIYLDRLLLFTCPALYVLLAWGIVSDERRVLMRGGAVIALFLVGLGIGNYYFQDDYAKTPLRDVIAFVAGRRLPDEFVLHTSDSSFLAGQHYDAAGQHILLYHPADQWLSPKLMSELQVPFVLETRGIVAGQKSFWLVVALDHIADEQMAEKAQFDQIATIAEQRDIGGVQVIHYVLESGPSSQ